jgi:hypothetical protein
MSDDIERREEGGAPSPAEGMSSPSVPDESAAPPSTPAQPQDELDRYLAEYDQQAAAQPKPEQQQPQQSSTIDEIDRLLDELKQPQQPDPHQVSADAQVEARARGLYEQEAYRGQLAQEFGAYCSKGQERLPDYLPEDYFRSQMLAMHSADPRLEVAFEAQFVDPVAVRVELERANAGLARARMDPLAAPGTVQALEQRVWKLEVAFHARTILKQAEAEIVKKANARKPVDPDLTADHAAVVAAMKGAGAKLNVAEPAPAFGHMGEAEFRRYTRENFGF